MRGYAWICVDICEYTQTYVEIRGYTLIYVVIRGYVQRDTYRTTGREEEEVRSMQCVCSIFAHVRGEAHAGFTWTYVDIVDLRRYAWIYVDVRGYTWMCADMCGYM